MPSRIFACVFFAETLQPGDLAGETGGFEFRDGLDAEFFVERLDFFGADAGNLHHLHQARGNGGLEFLVIGQPPGGCEFGDFFLKRLADCP